MPAGVRQGRRIAIGLALIAALIAAALIIFNLDAIVHSTRTTYTIVGVFFEAPRLRVGSPVRVAGYRVGEVTRIELLPPGGESIPPFAATLRLPTQVQAKLRRDSRIRLQRQRLMGEPVVEVTPGTVDSPILRPGDTLRASPPFRAVDLVTMASALRGSLDTLLAEEATLRERAEPLAEVAKRLHSDLSAARAEFLRFEHELRTGPLTAFLQDTTERAALERVAAAAGEIAELARARAATVSEADYRAALEGLAQRATALGTEVRHLRALLEEPRGFPGRWEQDPALRNAITATQVQLDSLIEFARRMPWRFFF